MVELGPSWKGMVFRRPSDGGAFWALFVSVFGVFGCWCPVVVVILSP